MSAVPSFLRPAGAGVELDVTVRPRASKSRLVGEHDGRLKLQLAAAPVDGEANEELVQFLATLFERPQKDVRLVRGATGRRKTVLLDGLTLAFAREKLEAAR